MSPSAGTPSRAAVLAVDGGNSKTEVVLLDRGGRVVGVARGPGSNHAHSDHQNVMALIDKLVAQASGGLTAAAEVAVLCLAGADYPQDERRLAATAAPYGWADRVAVRNDAFAMLRAGTDDEVGIALVCGAGINCVGRGPRVAPSVFRRSATSPVTGAAATTSGWQRWRPRSGPRTAAGRGRPWRRWSRTTSGWPARRRW